ncbi:MAG: hypothetical protein HUK15_08520, partial [Bacteroidales bacterium]|nr:hypothetical protein [Bacteroidales bacterium]
MRQKIHSAIFFVGLLAIAFFMPLSIFVTNAAIIMLLTNWVAECNFKKKWKRLLDDKSIIFFCLIFLLHLVWLANTSNFNYALNDLRVKLPLLVLPIVLGTSEAISEKKLNTVLWTFVGGALITTIIGFFFVGTPETDFRRISPFVSNIRMSLMLCLSIFILAEIL